MSNEYAPYAVDQEGVEMLNRASREANVQAVILLAERLLKSYYLNIEAHLMAAAAYSQIGDETKASYHGKFGKRLLDSILASGNGRTRETAFVVINVGEEYAVLRALGIQPESQSLLTGTGHHYEVFRYVNAQTGETAEMYFNIDVPEGWLDRSVGSAFRKTSSSGIASGETRPRRREKRKWWQLWKS